MSSNRTTRKEQANLPAPGVRVGRKVLTGLIAAIPSVAALLVGIALGPRLGSRIASHWSGKATVPDGFTATWPLLWFTIALTTILLVGSVVLIVAGRWSRVFPALLTTVGGFVSAAWIVSSWATAAAPSPEHASLGWRALLLIVPPLCGAAVYLLLPATQLATADPAGTPTLPLAVDDRISWTGTTGSWVLEVAVGALAALCIGTAIVAIVLGSGAAVTGVAVFGVATLSALLLVPVRLTVDRRGIRLSSVVLRIRLIKVNLANIDKVTVETIDPMQWGGWGYRISGTGRAYVARRGPGIVIHLRSGSAIAITTDRPDQPAAVANTLITHAEHP